MLQWPSLVGPCVHTHTTVATLSPQRSHVETQGMLAGKLSCTRAEAAASEALLPADVIQSTYTPS